MLHGAILRPGIRAHPHVEERRIGRRLGLLARVAIDLQPANLLSCRTDRATLPRVSPLASGHRAPEAFGLCSRRNTPAADSPRPSMSNGSPRLLSSLSGISGERTGTSSRAAQDRYQAVIDPDGLALHAAYLPPASIGVAGNDGESFALCSRAHDVELRARPPRRFAVADLISTVTGSVVVIATAIGGVLVIVYVAVSATGGEDGRWNRRCRGRGRRHDSSRRRSRRRLRQDGGRDRWRCGRSRHGRGGYTRGDDGQLVGQRPRARTSRAGHRAPRLLAAFTVAVMAPRAGRWPSPHSSAAAPGRLRWRSVEQQSVLMFSSRRLQGRCSWRSAVGLRCPRAPRAPCVGTGTQPARNSNRQNERRIAI